MCTDCVLLACLVAVLAAEDCTDVPIKELIASIKKLPGVAAGGSSTCTQQPPQQPHTAIGPCDNAQPLPQPHPCVGCHQSSSGVPQDLINYAATDGGVADDALNTMGASTTSATHPAATCVAPQAADITEEPTAQAPQAGVHALHMPGTGAGGEQARPQAQRDLPLSVSPLPSSSAAATAHITPLLQQAA
jgi:hypothetical protein